MDPEILRQWLPIGISLLSLVLATIALGWNIYRDVVLKPRVHVRFAIIRILAHGQKVADGPQFLRIGATNYGPGTVKIQMISGQTSPIWRRLLHRPQHFVIINDYTNPLNPKLPHRLEIGDTIDLLLPYDQKCFLKDPATHIGVSDSFGRLHYAPRKEIREAQAKFHKDFPTEP